MGYRLIDFGVINCAYFTHSVVASPDISLSVGRESFLEKFFKLLPWNQGRLGGGKTKPFYET